MLYIIIFLNHILNNVVYIYSFQVNDVHFFGLVNNYFACSFSFVQMVPSGLPPSVDLFITDPGGTGQRLTKISILILIFL